MIAVEPSDVMAAQRPPTIPPALRASAADLPLRDNSVDAAMAVLTIHHWDDELERGIEEMRRVARDTVVILTYDPLVSGEMWLMADYLPEVAELDRRIFPSPQQLVRWLGGADAHRGRAGFARHARLDARVILGASRARTRRAGT